MARKIKVKKTLGKTPVLSKIERNVNVANQIPLHPVVTDSPHPKADILSVSSKLGDEFTLHLKGDHEATLNMYELEKTLDTYYYDIAEYIEVLANANDDTTLPVSMGFEVYEERKPRTKKGLTIRDGNHSGEVFVEYPKLGNGATAYRADLALVISGVDPVFNHAGSCSITFMILQNVKPNSKYLIRLCGIFPSGEGPMSDPVPFRTKEW